MNAKKRTPTGIDTVPLTPPDTTRYWMIELIRQHLAAQGSRQLSELHANLDRSITMEERDIAIGRKGSGKHLGHPKYQTNRKGNHVSRNAMDTTYVSEEERRHRKHDRDMASKSHRRNRKEIESDPQRFAFPFEE